jgi:hypothetical protein
MAPKNKKKSCGYDLDDIRRHMALSVVDKLNYLEQLNIFFHKITPAKSKKIWEKLKSTGKV